MNVYKYVCIHAARTALVRVRALMVLSWVLLQVEDSWADCDLCKKWRLLPDTFVVEDGAPFQCSDVGISCADSEGPVRSLSRARSRSLSLSRSLSRSLALSL